MPLLMCPNDNTAMQTVERNGVELDICPECRGVWLDRGELEKLLETAKGAREERDRFSRDVEEFHRDPDDWKKRHPWDETKRRFKHDDDDYRYSRGHKKKKREFDIFDLFG